MEPSILDLDMPSIKATFLLFHYFIFFIVSDFSLFLCSLLFVKVSYDDGDEEILNLKKQRYELIGGDALPVGVGVSLELFLAYFPELFIAILYFISPTYFCYADTG